MICQSTCSRRAMCQMRRGSAEKTKGEKCQIASFGQSSRSPPPANPHPTANGRAPHSPAMMAGTAASAPTMAPE